MNKKISVKMITAGTLLMLLAPLQPTVIFADEFQSGISGIEEFPSFVYDHKIEKLKMSIVSQIEGTDTFESNLKAKGLKSDDVRLLLEARYVRIKNNMEELSSALSVPPPNSDPKYDIIIHALDKALQADSNFDKSAGTIGLIKDDQEYWMKRIGMLQASLGQCSELQFSPVGNNTKLQQMDKKNSPTEANNQLTSQKFSFWWYICIPITMTFAAFLLFRKYKTRQSSRQ